MANIKNLFKSYQASASLMPLISMCEKWVSLLNKHLFNGALPNVTVTIQPDARGSKTQSLGWMTSDQCWHNAKTNEQFYEVNLTATSLEGESLTEIITVLAHELVHVYNAINNIKDTSSNGHFHNLKFKTACESHGIICEKSDKYGWSTTTLTNETLEFVNKNVTVEDTNAVALFRSQQATKIKKTRKLYTYQCPCCGIKVRASKAISITCTPCNEAFELVDSPDMDNDQ